MFKEEVLIGSLILVFILGLLELVVIMFVKKIIC